MAREMTAQQIAEKHARRTAAAVEDMKAGVAAVQVAPGQQAAAKAQKMLDRVTEAVSSGRWGRRVASVSLEEWKRQMIEKGASRVSAGLQSSLPKTTAFYEEFMPVVRQVQSQVKSMPDISFEDSLARMRANAEGLHKFKRGGGGR
jgi:hypothetical protein